ILRHFCDFWLPNALLAAHLSGNPANLWENGAFLGDDRPHDGIGIVLCGPFVTTCGGPPETTRGLWKAQWQTFHGEAANLSDKAHSNLKLCQRGEWQDRMLVETVLSMLTLVGHLKKVMHRGWAYFQARLAFTMAAFNVLVQWHGFQP